MVFVAVVRNLCGICHNPRQTYGGNVVQKLKLTCLILASLMLTTCANQVPDRLGGPVAAEIASVRDSFTRAYHTMMEYQKDELQLLG